MARAARNPVTGVTDQQERFACEVIRTGRQNVAYRTAYDAGGMTAQVISVEASRLMDDPRILARVEHYRQVAVRKLEVSVERIAVEAARIAFFDPREMFDEDGKPIPVNELPEDAARVIAGMDIEELFEGRGDSREHVGRVKKYKIAPKLQALELLAKWKKMLIEQVEHGKPGEFDNMTDEQLEFEARDALAEAVKSGIVKLMPSKAKAARKSA